MVMELCRGGSLAGFLVDVTHEGEQSRLSAHGSSRALRHLLLALQFLHGRRVVHRDVKCDNLVLLEPVCIVPLQEATFKLCDFGLATRLPDESSSLHGRVGTPQFVAPEVLNREAYGRPCDLWASGCVLRACGTFAGAETLLRGLLEPRQHARLTASAALKHDWLEQGGEAAGAARGAADATGNALQSSRVVWHDWFSPFCCRRRSNAI